MKRILSFGSFILLVANASPSFASNYYVPNYWRCAADQLYGTPTDINIETRQAFGRTTWARNAYFWYKNSRGADPDLANKFWEDWMDGEVDAADDAPHFIDLYPVYAGGSAISDIWVGPGPNSTAKWFGTTYSQIKSCPYELPNNFTAVAGLCEAGCYTGEQEVRFGDELLPIGRAFASGETKVTTLSPGATFDSLTFIVNDIARWTADIAPADQQLITLRMQSGGELRVTTEHPILTSEGVMKRAMDLVAGESLVREDGSPDPIESTETQTVFTRVYNLRPVTLDLATNIIVAQGYLNGSARYQSEYVKYLNRVLLRKKIPAGLIPRGARAEAKTLERSR